MKYLKIFIALTFFSFVFIQCQKEMTNDTANNLTVQKQGININSDDVQKSVTNNGCEYHGGNDCSENVVDTFKITPFFPDSLVVGGVVYNIPPGLVESGCEVGGYFTFDICPGNVINVTEYIFFIAPECETLNDYLNGLPQDEYEVIFNYLSDLVQDMGTQYLAQKYSSTFPDDSYVNINWWQPVCYKTCYECIVDTDDGGPVPDLGLQVSGTENKDRNDNLELRGGDEGVREEPCSKGTRVEYKKVQCGDGCCKTEYTYKRNSSGVLEQQSKESEAMGSCEGTSLPCFGKVSIPCTYKCD